MSVLSLTVDRTATWIALADWQQSVMFNALPAAAISELECDLPCPRNLWDRKDATAEDVEMYRQQKHGSPGYLASLKEFMKMLMGERWDAVEPFLLNAITSGLELAIFGKVHVPNLSPQEG
jgi:hypothetical protein